MVRDHGGAGIKYQEYEDGWIYEMYAPIGVDQSVMPRAKTAKLIFEGRWLAAFEDEEVNYLTIWVERKIHESVFPDGPPAFRYYDEFASEEARASYSTWVDPNETNPSIKTVPIKLVELAKLEEAIRGSESPPDGLTA